MVTENQNEPFFKMIYTHDGRGATRFHNNQRFPDNPVFGISVCFYLMKSIRDDSVFTVIQSVFHIKAFFDYCTGMREIIMVYFTVKNRVPDRIFLTGFPNNNGIGYHVNIIVILFKDIY